MDVAAVITGIGAILAAAGGTVLTIREFRRRDRKDSARELEEYSVELHRCRRLHLHWRQYAFELQSRMVDAGLEPPDPPEDT